MSSVISSSSFRFSTLIAMRTMASPLRTRPDRRRLEVLPSAGRPAIAVAILTEPHPVAAPLDGRVAAGPGADPVALKRRAARRRASMRRSDAGECCKHEARPSYRAYAPSIPMSRSHRLNET